MKKITSLLLAVLVVFSLCVPVMAVERAVSRRSTHTRRANLQTFLLMLGVLQMFGPLMNMALWAEKRPLTSMSTAV